MAAWIRAAGLDVPALQVVGHSWGAMTAAALPVAGVRPATLVLLDPPAIPLARDRADGQRSVRAAVPATSTRPSRGRGRGQPGLADRRRQAKAEALIQLDVAAARAVLLDNGDWDGGLADLADPAAAGIPTWLIRGDPAAGGLVPDAALPAFVARLGARPRAHAAPARRTPRSGRTRARRRAALLTRARPDPSRRARMAIARR